jgi:hypothetical protein
MHPHKVQAGDNNGSNNENDHHEIPHKLPLPRKIREVSGKYLGSCARSAVFWRDRQRTDACAERPPSIEGGGSVRIIVL